MATMYPHPAQQQQQQQYEKTEKVFNNISH
jgi:hypothetical protein